MSGKRVIVTKESDSGRNERFQDLKTGASMSRDQFVKKIENGQYPDYHVREINDQKTPASNPDKSSRNNLG
ncbi:MAG: hypothetical protein PHP22_08000 [Oscillospiraceae bacterium]|jgi:hypothetical protein|nr:hypothetical protein [Oscillospiraceae bacterium]